MTTQYTPILKLALPVQGELSGTWGDVVNDNITSMVEQAIAGLSVVNTWTTNSHTLTTANGTTAESRAAMLSLTDSGTALTGAGSVICPALSKVYIVKNGTAQVITVKTAAGSGIAVPVGKTMLVYCDGTNVLEAVDHVVTLSAGTLTVTGAATFSGQTIISADALVATPSTYYDELVVQNSASGTGAGITILVNATNGFGGVKFGDSGNSNQFGIGFDASANNGFLDVSGSEALRIAADGSLSTPTLGTSNVRFGVNAGNSIIAGGNYNVVVGDEAGTAITTGNGNVFTGYASGDALTLGSSNTAIGRDSLGADTRGNHSVAIGRNALTTQNFTSATDAYNTAVGSSAGGAITTGIQNTLIGGLAGDALTDADENVAIGHAALSSDTMGSRSVAIGREALTQQNFTSATTAYNTAVGANAGQLVTTGTQNTLIGGLAGDAITTADNNNAIGFQSLSSNTTGSSNTANGSHALFSNTTASNNTAVGVSALFANQHHSI
jgi:hypothetical protein